MKTRNYIEALIDRLLMLFLVSECQKQGCRVSGKVKLLKLIFLSEGRMVEDEIKGFNYDFYRWNYGPMSNEVLQDLNWLTENGLLEKEPYFIGITSRGTELLNNCSALLNRNKEFLEYIQKVIREFGPYTGSKIKTVVYGIPKMGERKLIARTAHGEKILQKLIIEEARKRFLIDDEWVESLSILLDKEARDSLMRGIQDAKEGRVTKYEPLNVIN